MIVVAPIVCCGVLSEVERPPEGDMETIRVDGLFRYTMLLGLPIMFIGHFFTIAVLIFFVIRFDCPIAIDLLVIVLSLMGVFMLPLWFRTFLDRRSPGLEPPHTIQWSEESILFRGWYFETSIPPQDVIRWRVVRFLWSSRECNMIVGIKVRTETGRARWVNLYTVMMGKTRLLAFLEKQKRNRQSEEQVG
jgi:hypothetical protein